MCRSAEPPTLMASVANVFRSRQHVHRQLCRSPVQRTFAVMLLIASYAGNSALADDPHAGWSTGRATFYGAPGDGSIHVGSCEYYYLDKNVATGWDIAAISDAADDFSGSCGRCYEVACSDMEVHDNYGQKMDRTGACRDPSTSVIVQITDSCPCNYPANAFSNRRWCCGDAYHFDLSAWTFGKLADAKHGVIGLKYRRVDCHAKAANPAPNVGSPGPGISPPAGWTSSMDKRPW